MEHQRARWLLRNHKNTNNLKHVMQNILLLEDFKETRTWLRDVLSQAFHKPQIHEAATIEQAKKLIAGNIFDLAIIDINLPDGSGIDFIKILSEECPATFCVVATIFNDDQHIFSALQAGAHGYLLKEQPKKELIASLSGLLHGQPPLSPAIARRMLKHFQSSSPINMSNENDPSLLSDREKEILTLVAKGYKRGDIADMLGIKPNTVASHVKTIYGKLNVCNRAEATVEALRMGLVQL